MKYVYFFSFFIFLSCQPKTETTLDALDNKALEVKNQRQLRHVVLFKFKDAASDVDIKKVENAFSDLPSKIPEIKSYEWGINNSPEGLDKGFTHCFYLTFSNEKDRDIYLPHPDHKAFGEIAGPILEDVLVIDYWTGNKE